MLHLAILRYYDYSVINCAALIVTHSISISFDDCLTLFSTTMRPIHNYFMLSLAIQLTGRLESIPADSGWIWGGGWYCTPWTGQEGADIQGQTTIHTPTGNLESLINLHVLGLWEGTHAGTKRTCRLHKEKQRLKLVDYD